ncbi:hypothetical protein [Ahrensia kielensis]|uniref:hypothetical protein n=1 Tax=Ahrensia kielensis TaxID=76980 RepID=UPI00035D7DE1|nr:hypothetical protein [Ahrensia kielensis]
MVQTIRLCEIVVVLRVSALGRCGFVREVVGFDVRAVVAGLYVVICPIGPSEGRDVGLISSVSPFAFLNLSVFVASACRPILVGLVMVGVVYVCFVEGSGYLVAG